MTYVIQSKQTRLTPLAFNRNQYKEKCEPRSISRTFHHVKVNILISKTLIPNQIDDLIFICKKKQLETFGDIMFCKIGGRFYTQVFDLCESVQICRIFADLC